jgi:hypothetical protein
MSSRDQPFSDRAPAFWGHHRPLIEQLAGIAGQRQLRLQLRDALVGGGQLVGLHTRDALDNSGIDESLTFQRNRVAWQIPDSAATAATGSPDRSRATICRRTDDEYMRVM